MTYGPERKPTAIAGDGSEEEIEGPKKVMVLSEKIDVLDKLTWFCRFR